LCLVEKAPCVWGFNIHERWIQAEHISIIIKNYGQFQPGLSRHSFR
jgi:hypothetical protein